MIEVQFDRDSPSHTKATVIQAACRAALASVEADPDENITVVLTTDAGIRVLNRDYMGQNTATDVLSFPNGEADPETGERYLGDLIISVPFAQRQAQSAGHPLRQELELLCVHGTLHLLGHDHDTAKSKGEMWSHQSRALEDLGNPLKPG
jgi:probable rRNA maturation factor